MHENVGYALAAGVEAESPSASLLVRAEAYFPKRLWRS